MALFEVARKSVDTECCRIPINYFGCHWLTFAHMGSVPVFSWLLLDLLIVNYPVFQMQTL